MTVGAGGRELLLQVIRIYCLIVIIGMASGTSVRRIVVVALVAIIATHAGVCTHNRVK